MIVLPRLDEVQGPDWSSEGAADGSFLTGAAAPLPLGSFRLPDAPHLVEAAPTDDDPALRADSMRERAIGTFNRDLDGLFAAIAEGTDWSEGLAKYDQELGPLRQKHLAALRTPDDRAARQPGAVPQRRRRDAREAETSVAPGGAPPLRSVARDPHGALAQPGRPHAANNYRTPLISTL